MAFERRRSPRERRLNSDLRALQELSKESSILDYEGRGNPPEQYRIFFHGKGLWRVPDSTDVMLRDYHEVTITLTSAYPRMIPELAWQTPIFHPNISASGVVCLGGYGTHWVPSLMIDELCNMLWDMIRYKNFDIESPYNREAAVWTKNQTMFTFPVDERPLRNLVNVVREDASIDLDDSHGLEKKRAGFQTPQPNHPQPTWPATSSDLNNPSLIPPTSPVQHSQPLANPAQPSVNESEVHFLDATDPPKRSDPEPESDNDIMFIE